ncbi:MAG TPA: sulfur carrier protein ThiS adenylyltransferase ThiF, partial [Candidatus Desulfovibrio intestinigallinarum]|nr:sulfur carrier protein ThiS adenylyltransferase ThiF [Candidatus Desulfovibrio intestinigallinarum]
GSNAALMLARSGVEHFLLVDDDRVDASNLNRQQFWPRHVGMPKVEALRELLLELNPAAQVETLQLRLTAETMADVVRSCPLWLEALDGAQDKRLFVETVMAAGLRVASASGMGGYGREPLGRRRLGRLVVVGDFATDVAEAAPLAPRVTEAAALLADAALTWILE